MNPRTIRLAMFSAAFLVGLPLGFAPRSCRSEGAATASARATGEAGGSSPADPQGPGNRSVKRERKSEGNDAITFSPKQWRHLQRNGSQFTISVTDCIRWQDEALMPVDRGDGFGALFNEIETRDGGPDLSAIQEFLGLGDPQVRELKDALRRFGERLREAESAVREPQYAGDGKANVRFADQGRGRARAFEDLRGEIRGLLGDRQFARFEALAFPRESGFTPDGFEVSITRRAGMFHVDAPGINEFFDDGEESYKRWLSFDSTKPFVKRCEHTGVAVDWERLFREAMERKELEE